MCQWVGRLALTLLLVSFTGCSKNQDSGQPPAPATRAAAPAAVTHAPSQPPQARLVEDGGAPSPSTSTSDAPTRPGGEAGAGHVKRVPALELKQVASLEALERAEAEEAGWETGEEQLKSYWHPSGQEEEDGLGRFTLGNLSNPAAARGGEQSWMLLHQRGGTLAAYGPLITQTPWTPDYMHKVKSVEIALRPLQGSQAKLLWIQMQDKLSKPLDPAGEKIESTIRLLDYAFIVDASGRFTPVAFQLPEKLTRKINDDTQSESTIVVAFPSAARMVITAGAGGATPEQQAWIGEHSLTQ